MEPTAPPDRLSTGGALLHLLALGSLALAHPVLDVIARDPSYLSSFHAGFWEVVGLVAVALLGPPSALLGVVAFAGAVSPRARGGAFLAIVGLIAAAGAVPPFTRGGYPAALALPLAGVFGALVATTYARYAAVRSVVSVLSVSLVAVPLVFARAPAVKDLLLRRPVPVVAAPRIDHPMPIVLVVFDELPLATLMDASGRIDADRYPGFGALAREATWYRDATASAAWTENAIPALLTGNRPEPTAPPTATVYPRSLFTLLGGAYRIHAIEPFSSLCPAGARTELIDAPRPGEALAKLLRGAGRLAVRLFLAGTLDPEARRPRPAWAAEDPGLRQARQNDESLAGFRRFLAELGPKPGGAPALWFLHVLIPHSPLRYLPTLQRYTDQHENLAAGRLTQDSDEVLRLAQRDLLQAGVADALLRDLEARLRATGMWDRALVVVLADHGISFQTGTAYRAVGRGTLGEIAPVPLFIRAPGRPGGEIVDAAVETIDVLPTIAAEIGAEIPWPVDGKPVQTLDPAAPRRREIMNIGGGRLAFEDRLPVLPAARAHAAAFGAGSFENAFRIGPLPALVFRPTADLHLAGRADGLVKWSVDAPMNDVDPRADFVPVLLSGALSPPRDGTVVIALNGRVGATVPLRRDDAEFWTLLPWTLLTPGTNRVEFFLASPSGADLAPLDARGTIAPSQR